MQWTAFHKTRSYDPELPKLSQLAFTLFVLMRSHADCMGRFSADPVLVKAQAIPLFDARLEQVERALVELCDAGYIHLFDANGKRYLVYHNQDDQPSRGLKWKRAEWPSPPSRLCPCLQAQGGPSPVLGPEKGEAKPKGEAIDVGNVVGNVDSDSPSSSFSCSSTGKEGTGEKGGAESLPESDEAFVERCLNLPVFAAIRVPGKQGKRDGLLDLVRQDVDRNVIERTGSDLALMDRDWLALWQAMKTQGNGDWRKLKKWAKEYDAEAVRKAVTALPPCSICNDTRKVYGQTEFKGEMHPAMVSCECVKAQSNGHAKAQE